MGSRNNFKGKIFLTQILGKYPTHHYVCEKKMIHDDVF